jgi:hypothetical protein
MFSLRGPNNNEFALNLAVTDLRTTNSNSRTSKKKVSQGFVHQTTIAKDNADKEQSMISNNDQSIVLHSRVDSKDNADKEQSMISNNDQSIFNNEFALNLAVTDLRTTNSNSRTSKKKEV